MLTALAVLLMLAVGYAHLRDGVFTALCMFVNVILAGLAAFWLFEPFADWLDGIFQNGFWSGYEDFIALILLFAGAVILLRMMTNRLAPDMLNFPGNLQYIAAGIGIVTGYLLVGFLLCALETLPWNEHFLDFQPRVSSDTGPRSIFPPDRVWLAMMRYAGAHSLGWQEDNAGVEDPYERYHTFDRYGTFELRYLRYRRFSDSGERKTYNKELEREVYR
jgi:Colicin V production protein